MTVRGGPGSSAGCGRGRYEVTARRDGGPDEIRSDLPGQVRHGREHVRCGSRRAARSVASTRRSAPGIPSRGGEDLHLISRLLYAGSAAHLRSRRRDPPRAPAATTTTSAGGWSGTAAGTRRCSSLWSVAIGGTLSGWPATRCGSAGLLLRRSADREAGEFPRRLVARRASRLRHRTVDVPRVSRRRMRRLPPTPPIEPRRTEP